MLTDHGGNIEKINGPGARPSRNIIDFSSNLNPLGMPLSLKTHIAKNLKLLQAYPDPECRAARKTLGRFLSLEPERILLGNGSNELIHLIPRCLLSQRVLIPQPAFSEYESAARCAGAKTVFCFAKKSSGFRTESKEIIKHIPGVDLIILANPNNPTGARLEKKALLEVLKAALHRKTYVLVDEVFMEFVDRQEQGSLLPDGLDFPNLLIVKSLTKFFCLPGLRIGYAVGEKRLIRKLQACQPTWSVNALAQSIVSTDLFDKKFAAETTDVISKERGFLFARLEKIKSILPYPPAANFILCKILKNRLDAKTLQRRLLQENILIRNCDNFRGLNHRFFRVAVKKRRDNLRLLTSLEKICR